MYESHGWWFPDTEDHFPKMLDKNVSRGGPAEYQQPVRWKSLQYAKQTRTALDIGANVGLWSRDLVQHFDRVVAFEPVAMFRECLEKNVPNSKLWISPYALGDQDTTVRMNITQGNTGHTHVDPASIGQGDTQIVRLDNLAIEDVDYIKIDCEGFEYRVLQGAEQTIKNHRPVVVIEQKPHDAYSQEYGQFAAIELLKSWGMIRLDQLKDDWIMGWP
jgi:FkbM family methyltransferase